jgi:hypothetical protein
MEWLARHRSTIALLGCLTVAASLRFFDLGGAVVWEDEAVSYRTSCIDGRSALLANLMVTDATRAPFHLLAVQSVMAVFGKSLVVARAFSAFCGMGGVILVYVLGRQIYDRRTALLACGLAALNPLDVHHSREIRMYECLVLATCCCWALLFSFRQDAAWWKRVGYVLSLTVLSYTHPLGGLMVISLGLGYLILRPQLKLSFLAWIAINGACGLLLSPWILHYFDHPPQEFPRALSFRLLLEWPESFTGGNFEATWIGLIFVIFGIMAIRRQSGPTSWMIDRNSAALLAWFLVPPILLIVYSITRHPIFGERRYLLFVGPAYLLLGARGLSALAAQPRLALLAVFLFFNFQALDRRVFRIYRPDVRSAAIIAQTIDPNAAIVVVAPKRKQFYRCLLIYRDPRLTAPVVPIQSVVETLRNGVTTPDEVVWMAIERPKNQPLKPVPEILAQHYVTERTFELPNLTLTYNRRIHEPVAGSPPIRR